MDDEANLMKAVEFALEWSKNITTLSTAAFVLSATFLKDIFGTKKIVWPTALYVTWVMWVGSICFGILFIGALCSQLQSTPENELNIYDDPEQFFGATQNILFFLGLLSFGIFAARNLVNKQAAASHGESP